MSECSWHPSKDEVKHILEELRPIIAEVARREEADLQARVATTPDRFASR